MRKAFFISVVLLMAGLFLFTGCYYKMYSSKKYFECSDGTQVLDKAQCDALDQLNDLKDQMENIEYNNIPDDVVDETEEDEVAEDKTDSATDGASAEADEVFAKFAKVKTVEFTYSYNGELPKNTYYVSKEKMKIVLESRFGVVNEKYDVVYLDLINKKAVGYCENNDRDLCPDRDKKISAEYDDFIIETPFDWVESITSASLTGKSKTLENRNVVEVNFVRDGKEGVMFADSFFGTPIHITYDGNTYVYKDIMMNEATDEDLEHQFEE